MNPEPITPNYKRDDHDLIIEVSRDMGHLTDMVRDGTLATTRLIADHETRIRTLETGKETMQGDIVGARRTAHNFTIIVSVIVPLVGVLVAIVAFLIPHWK